MYLEAGILEVAEKDLTLYIAQQKHMPKDIQPYVDTALSIIYHRLNLTTVSVESSGIFTQNEATKIGDSLLKILSKAPSSIVEHLRKKIYNKPTSAKEDAKASVDLALFFEIEVDSSKKKVGKIRWD